MYIACGWTTRLFCLIALIAVQAAAPSETLVFHRAPASTLTIADAHFLEESRPGCANASHDIKGDVLASGNRLTLRTTSNTPGWPHESRDFVLVPWGGWLYLVEADRALAFCNAVNLGSEPAGTIMIGTPSFYRRERDDATSAPKRGSLPNVPDEWNRYILHAVLRATITPNPDAGDTALINLGTNDGVFVGLEFIVRDVPVNPALFRSPRVDRVATVTRATLSHSQLRYRNYKEPIPTGLTVETGLHFTPLTK